MTKKNRNRGIVREVEAVELASVTAGIPGELAVIDWFERRLKLQNLLPAKTKMYAYK